MESVSEIDALADRLYRSLGLEVKGPVTMEDMVYNATSDQLEYLRRELLREQNACKFDDEGTVKRFKEAMAPKNENSSTSADTSCFQNQIMMAMLIDTVDQMPHDLGSWLCIVCPEGSRVLVIAAHKTTRVYSLDGVWICEHNTHLPGGSSSIISAVYEEDQCTVLDCLYDEEHEIYYVLDLLCWAGTPYYKTECHARITAALEKVKGIPSLKHVTHTNPFRFLPLPVSYNCQQSALCSTINRANFNITGLLFYHRNVQYIPGLTPLGLWVETSYISVLLGIQVQKLEFSYLKGGPCRKEWRRNRYEVCPEKCHTVQNSAYIIPHFFGPYPSWAVCPTNFATYPYGYSIGGPPAFSPPFQPIPPPPALPAAPFPCRRPYTKTSKTLTQARPRNDTKEDVVGREKDRADGLTHSGSENTNSSGMDSISMGKISINSVAGAEKGKKLSNGGDSSAAMMQNCSASKHDVSSSFASQSSINKSDTSKSDMSSSDTSRFDMSKSDSRSDMSKSDTSKSEAVAHLDDTTRSDTFFISAANTSKSDGSRVDRTSSLDESARLDSFHSPDSANGLDTVRSPDSARSDSVASPSSSDIVASRSVMVASSPKVDAVASLSKLDAEASTSKLDAVAPTSNTDTVASLSKPDGVSSHSKPDTVASPSSSEVLASPSKGDAVASSFNSDAVASPSSSDAVASPSSSNALASPSSSDAVASPSSSDAWASPCKPDAVALPELVAQSDNVVISSCEKITRLETQDVNDCGGDVQDLTQSHPSPTKSAKAKKKHRSPKGKSKK